MSQNWRQYLDYMDDDFEGEVQKIQKLKKRKNPEVEKEKNKAPEKPSQK